MDSEDPADHPKPTRVKASERYAALPPYKFPTAASSLYHNCILVFV
jgi:hypothetical protein